MKGIETLAKDFMENHNVCDNNKILNQGDRCFIVDPSIIDPETEFYAIIPVVVVMVDNRPSRFNRIYYWFRAEGSKYDEGLNTQQENFMGGVLNYYKFLESTSPYILLSNPAEE